MADIIISEQAYCKIILHVVKYPYAAVNGILLAEKPKNKEIKQLYFIDCIPLFHLTLSLAPTLEVALTQVDSYCKSKGFVIAGYYQANQHIKDSSPNLIAYRIADKICENFVDSCLVMIENKKMSLSCSEVPFKVYQLHDNKWRPKDASSIRIERGHKSLDASSSLLDSKVYRELIDFDNHLDDLSLDWRNLKINDKIKKLLDLESFNLKSKNSNSEKL